MITAWPLKEANFEHEFSAAACKPAACKPKVGAMTTSPIQGRELPYRKPV